MTKVQIDGNHWLEAPAAAAYARARAAGLPAGVTSAGRTRAEQQALYDAWRAGRMPGTPSVARPGTSKHESGRALDLPGAARAWMHEHGPLYGWINPAWAKQPRSLEPWHFEYFENLDKSRPAAGVATKPLLEKLEEKTMPLSEFLLWSGPEKTRRWAFVQAGRAIEISPATGNNLKHLGAASVATDAATFNDFIQKWGK